MSSLQDQLLNAGLVDTKQAKQAKKDKRKAQKQQHKSKSAAVDETKAAAAQARAEKAERDRKLNQERKLEAERKAIAAQIKQLIEMNRQPRSARGEEETAYNFTDGKQIKKIHVSAAIQEQLSRGRLAIVKLGEGYELVPAAVADKIRQRDEVAVVSQQVVDQASDEDDPYADYEIPDDLMW